ncbi:hypothetical protein [Streptomyces sp. T12]|uniref:3-oxoacyl-ACP synthase III family protein n=1 Tax=unclassified Streptomyces TaxID=2593676 RepID=UPI0027D3186C|nr:hypothetical protein [Streptomyces sp. T12]
MSELQALIGVLSAGAYLPQQIVTNEEVAAGCRMSAEWIVERTGVLRRHRAAPDQAPSDLAAQAVLQALERAGLSAQDLGLLVLATSIPDEFGPPTACRVQALLGARNAVAFRCDGGVLGMAVRGPSGA